MVRRARFGALEPTNLNDPTPEPLGPGVVELLPRRGGLTRATTFRGIECVCACGRTFVSTGPAAAHARAARHRVAVSYSVRFAFVPEEMECGAGS